MNWNTPIAPSASGETEPSCDFEPAHSEGHARPASTIVAAEEGISQMARTDEQHSFVVNRLDAAVRNARDMAFRQKSLSRQFFLSAHHGYRVPRSGGCRKALGKPHLSRRPSSRYHIHRALTPVPARLLPTMEEKGGQGRWLAARASHPTGITYPLLFAVSVLGGGWRRILELISARSYLFNQNFRLVDGYGSCVVRDSIRLGVSILIRKIGSWCTVGNKSFWSIHCLSITYSCKREVSKNPAFDA